MKIDVIFLPQQRLFFTRTILVLLKLAQGGVRGTLKLSTELFCMTTHKEQTRFAHCGGNSIVLFKTKQAAAENTAFLQNLSAERQNSENVQSFTPSPKYPLDVLWERIDMHAAPHKVFSELEIE